jgi:elongation factor 1-alpha
MNAPEVNVVLCGHAKHGKSTLAGRLLYEMGAATDEQLASAEAAIRKRYGASVNMRDLNPYSMLFLQHRPDTFTPDSGEPDNPSRSVRAETAGVELEGRRLNIIDTPGWSRFIDNIVFGIYLADYAVIVVDAIDGVAQGTVTLAKLLHAFRIPTLAVCVTKLDAVKDPESTFLERKREIGAALFRDQEELGRAVIPVSGLEGWGIVSAERDPFGWYKGPRLTAVIREQTREVRSRRVNAVRVVVDGPSGVYSPRGVGVVVVGCLEVGALSERSRLLVEPASHESGVKQIVRLGTLQRARAVNEPSGRLESEIEARAIIGVQIRGQTRDEMARLLERGGVLGGVAEAPRGADEIEADVVFFEKDTVYGGKEYICISNGCRSACTVRRIRDRFGLEFEWAEGGESRRAARRTEVGERLTARIVFKRPICIEDQSMYGRMTRFVLREQNRVIGCGVCKQVVRGSVDNGPIVQVPMMAL